MDASDSMALKRLRELALRAAHTGRPQFTRFMDPSLTGDARRVAGENGVSCAFYGGYADAERVMAAYYDSDAPEPWEYPVQGVRVTWNEKFAHPAHRDLMGAVMGLGLDRDTLGDVALGTWRDAPCAWVFALPEVADYIAANLDSAGRAPVKAEVSQDAPEIAPPEGVSLRVTVQTARLDAVLAAGYRLSRAEAQRLVAAGLVKLNHVPNEHTDAHVAVGDLISARGHGRLKVVEAPGESRRGRQVLTLFRYGK